MTYSWPGILYRTTVNVTKIAQTFGKVILGILASEMNLFFQHVYRLFGLNFHPKVLKIIELNRFNDAMKNNTTQLNKYVSIARGESILYSF